MGVLLTCKRQASDDPSNTSYPQEGGTVLAYTWHVLGGASRVLLRRVKNGAFLPLQTKAEYIGGGSPQRR
jgi:hypothetical protein